MARKTRQDNILKILKHLEDHTKKLEKVEKSIAHTTKRVERLEILLGVAAILLALIDIYLTFFV